MPRTLLSIYPKTTDRFDEMLAEGGAVRPSWQAFFDHLVAATPEQMSHRLDYVRRRIQENGVTYNVYADPKGTDRPWELDPLPLILSAGEWQEISSAVRQRARLLNAVLGDLYGEQTLLRDGTLPSALVYGHNNFLWPCQGVKPPGDIWLHLYAADLARSPDGRWCVIGDRTQAPSGAGYALENRVSVGQDAAARTKLETELAGLNARYNALVQDEQVQLAKSQTLERYIEKGKTWVDSLTNQAATQLVLINKLQTDTKQRVVLYDALTSSLKTAQQQDVAHRINEIGVKTDQEAQAAMAAIGAATNDKMADMLEAHEGHMVFARQVLEQKAKADERFARRFAKIVEKHDKNAYGE